MAKSGSPSQASRAAASKEVASPFELGRAPKPDPADECTLARNLLAQPHDDSRLLTSGDFVAISRSGQRLHVVRHSAIVATVIESKITHEVRDCMERGYRFVAEVVSTSSRGGQLWELRAWGQLPGQ